MRPWLSATWHRNRPRRACKGLRLTGSQSGAYHRPSLGPLDVRRRRRAASLGIGQKDAKCRRGHLSGETMKRWWYTPRECAWVRKTVRRVRPILTPAAIAGAVYFPIPSHAAGDQVLHLRERGARSSKRGHSARSAMRRSRTPRRPAISSMYVSLRSHRPAARGRAPEPQSRRPRNFIAGRTVAEPAVHPDGDDRLRAPGY